tara:strand:+ start:319 stop:1026 length:708 start_codon:yes stop_codon:yes gene_type:complete
VAVEFSAIGSITVTSTITNLALVAPTCTNNDILIAVLIGKDNIDHQGASADWTEIGTQANNTINMTTSHWWKRAVAADSGATFTFTKTTDNNIFFAGVISCWKGALIGATPIDVSTPTTSNNASSDTVTYADFTPTCPEVTIIASGIYADDNITALGTISGTNPTLTNRYNVETGTGTDCAFFAFSGASVGCVATGARSHTTTSTTDAVNQGWLFGLCPEPTGLLPFCIAPQPTR